MHKLLDKFTSVYNNLNKNNITSLDNIYTKNMTFIDPFHQFDSLEKFKSYCDKLYLNIISSHFIFKEQLIESNRAVITWDMHIIHPKLNKGNEIIVPGISHLKADNLIYFHQDYFDGGALIYENISVLKSIILSIKRRMNS